MSARLSLVCHPRSPGAAVAALTVETAVDGAGLALAYRLTGDPAGLAIPAPRTPAFADNLWQHTCFEAFLATAGDPAYREFNFSPSGQWAAYDFSGYRQRREGPPPPLAPRFNCRLLADGLAMDVLIPASLLPPGPWDIALTAVVEAAGGSKSYWALCHPGENPDFHRREAFTLSLPVSANLL